MNQNTVSLRDFFSAKRSIDCLPFISLRDRPIAMAVPTPVQLGDNLLHALDKSVNRAHTMLRVFGAALERRQGDDAVVYDNSDLLGRREGGVGARQHCYCARGENDHEQLFVEKRPQKTYIGIEYWSRKGRAVRSGKSSSLGCGRRVDVPSWREWLS